MHNQINTGRTEGFKLDLKGEGEETRNSRGIPKGNMPAFEGSASEAL